MPVTPAPKITFFLPSPQGYILLDESTSRVPLRVTRDGVPPADGPTFNYGRYFEAITQVISKDGFGPLVSGATRQLGKDVAPADIDDIRIYAEKHGSDYHPARVEVTAGRDRAAFVMNVAITARGRDRLSRELAVLEKLTKKHGRRFLPCPYFSGEASLGPGKNGKRDGPAVMFLADWFDGYHEFHLSQTGDGEQALLLWDTDKGSRSLSRKTGNEIYQQAARILTVYYDTKSYEQIFPWHHAAGDFVARAGGGAVDVKLITARQYAPMIEPGSGITSHEALLFFLLNLSVRMRLDRLDGTGPVAWAGDGCLDATVRGFLEGIQEKAGSGTVDTDFINDFVRYCVTLGADDLSERFHALVHACDPLAPDLPVIKGHLSTHIFRFHSALQSLMPS